MVKKDRKFYRRVYWKSELLKKLPKNPQKIWRIHFDKLNSKNMASLWSQNKIIDDYRKFRSHRRFLLIRTYLAQFRKNWMAKNHEKNCVREEMVPLLEKTIQSQCGYWFWKYLGSKSNLKKSKNFVHFILAILEKW